MMRIIQNSQPGGAKSYYSTSDYYTEGQELAGRWRGRAAERLGLAGSIEKDKWDALCDNRNPDTGRMLTQRQRDNRRVGYDFNFHVPKSVSVLYSLTDDARILEAFRGAVDETMRDIESEMQTRVRSHGRNEDRTTASMVWGEFIHTTARPVDGVPDPHLHAHCFVFNVTWDGEEQRWKAGQFAGLKRDAPYFEALFHSRLARGMEELGLPVVRTKRAWEIEGVPASAIRQFSRRTALIEKEAEKQGLHDSSRKGELGAKTRERKRKTLRIDELRELWRARLSPEETRALASVAAKLGSASIAEDPIRAREGVQLALAHSFERSAVVPERRLQAEAMRRTVGAASAATARHILGETKLLAGTREGQRLVSTPAVLAEEQRMLDFARRGRGACMRLAAGRHAFRRDWLDAGQRHAVEHVLGSRDRVVMLRGAAGTGKTVMMQEAVVGIEAGGHRVLTFAPSAEASRGVLRQEGFLEADTVAKLLVDERLQQEAKGQVLWIDEAGLLGSRDMGRLFDLADRLDARVVLAGDRKQHGSVERGAALRLLESEAGLIPATLREIKRQSGDYKAAVMELSEGRIETGFRALDRLGWIREIPGTQRDGAIAEDYAAAVDAGKSALIVSPTHREGDRITARVRDRLKDAGRLGRRESGIEVLQSANLTEADRADAASYEPGDVLVFHQNAKGFTKGERVVVRGKPPPLSQAARFQVYRTSTLPIAVGEVLRVTRNGTTMDGKHRLNNGARVTVKEFDRGGNLILANGWKVARGFGHLAYGYVSTSHASQGKTVDRVFIGQSAESLPASSMEQFYVSVSRGRERTTIYTDDKHELLRAVSRPEPRLTATELVKEASRRTRNRVCLEAGQAKLSKSPSIPERQARDHAYE